MLWKSNLWPNLLWYHEEPVSSNHCNLWHGCTAGFPRVLACCNPRGSGVSRVSTFGLLHWQIRGTIYRQLSDYFGFSLKMDVVWAVLLCVEGNLFWGSLWNRLVWNVWEGKWNAIKTGQFSVHDIIAVYLSVVHSPWPWQHLGWNQLTGGVVRGGTCLNNFSPAGAAVVWADSQGKTDWLLVHPLWAKFVVL